MSVNSPTELKRALRRVLRQRRQALSPAERQLAARRVAVQVQRFLRPGRRVALYMAAGSELSLQPLLQRARKRRCRVFVPVVPRRGRRLGFVELTEAIRWRVSRLGIREPLGHGVTARQLDLVCLPLVGFDDDGFRLGQGGGYYDTTLAPLANAARRPWLLGCAFACQRVDAVPREAHDQPLDGVLTEAGRWPRQR